MAENNRPSIFGTFEWALFGIYAIFIFTTTFSVAAGSIAGGVASLLFLVFAVRNRIRIFDPNLKWFYLWAGLYLFWSVLSSQIAHPGFEALRPLGREWMWLLVPTGIWLFQQSNVNRRLLYALAVGVAFISLYSIGQFIWGWNFLKPNYVIGRNEYGYWITGNFTGSVTFGIYYATAGAFLFAYGLKSGWRRPDRSGQLLALVGLVAMGVAVLSAERGPTLAVFVAVITLAFLIRSKRVLIGIGIALLLMAAIGFQSGVFQRSVDQMSKDLSMLHDRGRLFIWSHSLKVVCNNPITGVGPGYMHEGYAKVVPSNFPDITIQGHAHNDILNIAAESGFPCALFFVACWISVIGCCFKAYRSSVLAEMDRRLALGALVGSIGFFVTSLFDVPFAGPTVRHLLMFVWAAGLAMYLKSKTAQSTPPNDLTSPA